MRNDPREVQDGRRGGAPVGLRPTRSSLAAAVLMLIACTRTVPPPREPEGWDPSDEKLTPAELAADLRATVYEAYKALSGGYEEAYLDGLDRDARLILIDVEPEDVVIGYEPVACRLRRQFPDKKMELVSKALEVHVSRDGRSGWIYDELSYRVTHAGRRAIIPLRVTAVYERINARWIKVMEHVSYGIPDEEAMAWGAEGKAPFPGKIGDDTPQSQDAAEVRRVILGLVTDVDDTRVHHVATDARALVVGSDPEREVRGAAVAELSTLRALYGYDYRTSAGDVRVRVALGGQVAWAAANVTLSDSQGKRLLGLRATWVLEKDPKNTWKAVQTHVSIPVPRDILALRAFGETITQAISGDTLRAASL